MVLDSLEGELERIGGREIDIGPSNIFFDVLERGLARKLINFEIHYDSNVTRIKRCVGGGKKPTENRFKGPKFTIMYGNTFLYLHARGGRENKDFYSKVDILVPRGFEPGKLPQRYKELKELVESIMDDWSSRYS